MRPECRSGGRPVAGSVCASEDLSRERAGRAVVVSERRSAGISCIDVTATPRLATPRHAATACVPRQLVTDPARRLRHAPELLCCCDAVTAQLRSMISKHCVTRRHHFTTYGPITIAIRARFEYDSTTIRLRFERDTTSYEELCAFEQ